MKAFAFAPRGIFLALAATAAVLILAGAAQPRNFLQLNSIQRDFANQYPGSQNTIQVRSSLVQIDAVVTDKNGKHIAGLKAENFQLSEDNHTQKLTAADYYEVGFAPSKNESATPIGGSTNSAHPSQRLIVLFFDCTSMFPADLLRAVDESKKFIENQMTPNDLVSVVTFDKQLRIHINFQNDRETLKKALDSVITGKKPFTGGPESFGDDFDSPVEINRDLPPAERSLEAARVLGEALGFPGRKSVIHFTGGLAPPSGRQQATMDITPAINAATNSADDNDVLFDEVDARGLITICPCNPLSAAAPREGEDCPCACVGVIGSRCESVLHSRNTLYALAANTGGHSFFDLTDFSPIFKQVQEESTGYYLLAYDPSNKKLDGTYRSISVKLVGVPGGHIAFRPGYYAPKDQKQK
jgi:VWFA-related protein